MPSSQRSVEQSINTDELVNLLRLPLRNESLGTRKNGVWEREKCYSKCFKDRIDL